MKQLFSLLRKTFFTNCDSAVIATTLSALLFAAFVTNASIYAQDAGNAPAAVENKAAKTENKSDPKTDAGNAYLAEAGQFHLGEDPTIWVLIVLFNLGLAVALERSWLLWRNRGRNDELVEALRNRLDQGVGSAALLAGEFAKGYGMEGRVAGKMLQGWGDNLATMAEYANAALIAEKRNIEKRLVILSTLGNNTPFIGLLGTVLGIMKAFRDLALMGDAGPAVVMKGISEALIATAIGLAVAIPCVMAYNALSKSVKSRLSCAEEIISIIKAMYHSLREKSNTVG